MAVQGQHVGSGHSCKQGHGAGHTYCCSARNRPNKLLCVAAREYGGPLSRFSVPWEQKTLHKLETEERAAD